MYTSLPVPPCMHVCVCVCLHVCMSVGRWCSMYVCMYVRTYDMHLCVCTCMYTSLPLQHSVPYTCLSCTISLWDVHYSTVHADFPRRISAYRRCLRSTHLTIHVKQGWWHDMFAQTRTNLDANKHTFDCSTVRKTTKKNKGQGSPSQVLLL